MLDGVLENYPNRPRWINLRDEHVRAIQLRYPRNGSERTCRLTAMLPCDAPGV
jgi:hypothetical protein